MDSFYFVNLDNTGFVTDKYGIFMGNGNLEIIKHGFLNKKIIYEIGVIFCILLSEFFI